MANTLEKLIPTPKSLDEIKARIESSEAQRQAAHDEFERQRTLLGQREAPLNRLLAEWERQNQIFCRVEAAKVIYAGRNEELKERTRSELRKENREQESLHNLYEMCPHLVWAGRGLADCEWFSKETVAKLQELEKEISAMAKSENLAYLLPATLKRLA